jgi:hypothetical protein
VQLKRAVAGPSILLMFGGHHEDVPFHKWLSMYLRSKSFTSTAVTRGYKDRSALRAGHLVLYRTTHPEPVA